MCSLPKSGKCTCQWAKEERKKNSLTDRTIKIINRGGRILLRQKSKGAEWIPKYWYLHNWTNIAAGPDHAVWGKKENALEFFNLLWAFTIAPLYDCKVVAVYPKKKEAKKTQEQAQSYACDCNNPISAGTGGDPSYNRKADGSR